MGKTFLLLGLAGAAGTWARVGLSRGLQNLTGWSFPVGTLAANCLGCFLFGLLWLAVEEGRLLSEETRWILTLGFLGAFTTFSALILETGVLAKSAQLGNAVIYLTMQNVLGLAALYVGWMIGKLMVPAS